MPPQMGGCYESGYPQQLAAKRLVDLGPYDAVPDVGYPEPPGKAAEAEALRRMLKFRGTLLPLNPEAGLEVVDVAVRAALTRMMGESASAAAAFSPPVVPLPAGSDAALRYMRDRISVPRDMGIWAGRKLRAALEETAKAAGGAEPSKAIPYNNRRDQNPMPFKLQPAAASASS